MPVDILVLSAAVLLIWNVIVFGIYGMDKGKARRGQWRTSETALLFCAAFMGGPGAWTGMLVFRHKTKHMKFVVGVPLLTALNIAIAAAAVIFLTDIF